MAEFFSPNSSSDDHKSAKEKKVMVKEAGTQTDKDHFEVVTPRNAKSVKNLKKNLGKLRRPLIPYAKPKKRKTEKPSPKQDTLKKSATPVVNGKPLEYDPNLPAGWKRQVVQRKSGATAGKYDLYIFGPDGRKFRSRNELSRYLRMSKSKLSVDTFDFTIFGKDYVPADDDSNVKKTSSGKPDTSNGTPKSSDKGKPVATKKSSPAKKGRGRPASVKIASGSRR